MKLFSLMGGMAVVFNEKLTLEKKWRYFDKFYPEPTQLQRTLVAEAKVVKNLEAAGQL